MRLIGIVMDAAVVSVAAEVDAGNLSLRGARRYSTAGVIDMNGITAAASARFLWPGSEALDGVANAIQSLIGTHVAWTDEGS